MLFGCKLTLVAVAADNVAAATADNVAVAVAAIHFIPAFTIFSRFFRFPGWRQGMLALAEAVSLSKPTDGWFLPNCGGSVSTLLDERNAEERRAARVVAFDQESEEEEEGLEEAEKINVLQVLIFSE